jgi:hypothetical protein
MIIRTRNETVSALSLYLYGIGSDDTCWLRFRLQGRVRFSSGIMCKSMYDDPEDADDLEQCIQSAKNDYQSCIEDCKN